MKVLGAVLVVLSGLCLGLRGAGELRRRESVLVDLRQMIQAFRTGMQFSAKPLRELVAENRKSAFCRLASEDGGVLFDPKGALERAGERLLKSPEDRELYRNLIRKLGESDVQSQLEHLELYGAMAEESLGEAREERKARSRLYVCLGLFGGITLCLVLL